MWSLFLLQKKILYNLNVILTKKLTLTFNLI